LRSKSKAPPFKERRTGHPKFNYKARTTRPRTSRRCRAWSLSSVLKDRLPPTMNQSVTRE
jgi:hypothetical protein